MKRRRLISIALILGSLLWLILTPAALGQPRGVRHVNTGVVRLGPGQTLRIIIHGQAGDDKLTVVFRRSYYVGSANGGVWKSMVASQDTSAPVSLNADEAASIDASQAGFDGVRIEAIIRGYTGATNVNAGVLQIMNSDGSVAAFFDIFVEI